MHLPVNAMILRNAQFVRSAADPSGFPGDGRPRVVFAGRSNVGKSSTINSLVGRKGFARVSASPGKTIFVNLFLAENRLWLVDLPGYGYSKTSAREKERYSALIDAYLHADMKNIHRFMLIVDIRHEPTADDRLMAEWAQSYGLPLAVIANKADKLKPSQVAGQLSVVRSVLDLPESVPIIAFSAEKHTGRDEIIKEIFSGMGE